MAKIVLITGASSGIGKETAMLLAKKGFKVYASARRKERMLEMKMSGIEILKIDVTDEHTIQEGIKSIINIEGRIDILINNAGYGSFGALEDVELSEAKAQFEVNIFGLARITQLVLPYMRKQGSGRIINISSMGGSFGQPHGSWYHASKYALEGLSDCLRLELYQFGIDVVLIRPGAIRTEWNKIARDRLIKASGHSVYGYLAKKHFALMMKADEFGSSPEVIAKTIQAAVMSKKPKARYVSGRGALFVLFFKKILPDKIFDTIFLFLLKKF